MNARRSPYCPVCGNHSDHEPIYNCPDRIEQPKLPSANSTFPPDELAEIKGCIAQANELLLSIGLEQDEDERNLRAFQLTIRKLRGNYLLVSVEFEEKSKQVRGILKEAGLDFIVLETEVKNLLIIPTERILLIKHLDKEQCPEPSEQELLCIDDDLRLDLTLHFSEVVSRSPFLINLFYGLKLQLYLDRFIGCTVYVRSENDGKEREGILIKVDKRKITFIDNDKEKQAADFDELSYIEIEREALTLQRQFEGN